MIGFDAKIMAGSGNDLGALIAQIIADNSLSLAQKKKLSVDKMNSIVRRAQGKTGSLLFRSLKKGFTDGTLNIEPLRRHPANNAMMADTIAAFRPWELKNIDGVPKPITRSRKPGGKLKNLMQYQLSENDSGTGGQLTVGLIPERRGGDKWAKRFSDWQESGEIDRSQFYNFSLSGMFKYLSALGMPVSKFPRRPERNVIGKIEARERPIELFEKLFLERLLK